MACADSSPPEAGPWIQLDTPGRVNDLLAAFGSPEAWRKQGAS